MHALSYVYIMANHKKGTLYVGATSDLVGTITKHKLGTASSFTQKYDIKLLVWFEMHDNIGSALAAQKQVKSIDYSQKIKLIEELNPRWEDLSYDF